MASIIPMRRPGVAPEVVDPLVTVGEQKLGAAPATRSRRNAVIGQSLMIADVLGLSLAFAIATVVTGETEGVGPVPAGWLFIVSLPVWILLAKLLDMYRRDAQRLNHCTTDDLARVFHLVTTGAWLLIAWFALAGAGSRHMPLVLTFWVLALCTVPVSRTIVRRRLRQWPGYAQNTVIVGAGDVGQLIGRKLHRHPEYGANVVGFVDRAPKIRRVDLPEDIPILGSPQRLVEIIDSLAVERVIIAFSDEPSSELLALVRQLRPLNVHVDVVPRLFELVGPGISVHAAEGLPLLGLAPRRFSGPSRMVKRLLDLFVSATALVVLAPVLAYIALRIRADSPGPVLFRQTRLGAGMTEFTALKFRTMKVETDPEVHRDYIRRSMSGVLAAESNGMFKLDQADSITRVGRWLRRTSLDELPQLINVLRGDMSLVGPRPCIPYEVENFAAHHLERFAVPQGITGLWQVTARAHSTYLEALDLDVAYVNDWSLGLDLKLLLRTPLELLRQRGSTA